MKQILTHLFTGKDNRSFSLGRVLWAFSAVTLFILEVLHLCFHFPFNEVSYAGAMGTILTTGGATLLLQKNTEPGT